MNQIRIISDIIGTTMGGRTIAFAKREMAEGYKVDPATPATINGHPVSDEYVIKDGDSIEFVAVGAGAE